MIFLETTEVLGQISVFDVLGRKNLNKYSVFYSTNSQNYEKAEVEAKSRIEAVEILAKELKKKGITHFLYKFRG